jgi:hypothetical protein
MKISVPTLDANHAVTDSMQSITASSQKLTDSVAKSVSTACSRYLMCQAN